MIGIAKVTDGFFTANEILASFRWSDFSINSYLPYVKLGERPLICSSFCGKKGAYTTECNVIVMDTAGKNCWSIIVPGVNQVVYLSILMKILLFFKI